MPHVLTRTHVTAPKELIEEVDRLVGPRRRSEFFTEAAAEKLKREKLPIRLILIMDSVESWADLMRDVARRGMRVPVLAVGDGALDSEERYARCFSTRANAAGQHARRVDTRLAQTNRSPQQIPG